MLWEPALPRRVIDAVAETYGLRAEIITSKRRSVYVAEARLLGYLVLRRYSELSLPEIARAFGRTDHSTVIHGIRRTELQLRHDPGLQFRFDRVLLLLNVTKVECQGFALALVHGKAVDFIDEASRSLADVCARPYCLTSRSLHAPAMQLRPDFEVAA